MYAIVDICGSQHKLTKGDTIEVTKFNAKKGEQIFLDKVLFIVDNSSVIIGKPYLNGARVTCEVASHFKGEKIIAYKWRRRKGYHRKVGHRQGMSRLLVKEITY